MTLNVRMDRGVSSYLDVYAIVGNPLSVGFFASLPFMDIRGLKTCLRCTQTRLFALQALHSIPAMRKI